MRSFFIGLIMGALGVSGGLYHYGHLDLAGTPLEGLMAVEEAAPAVMEEETAPAEEPMAEEVPAEAAPAEEAMAEDMPAEEAPMEEAAENMPAEEDAGEE